MVKADAPVVLAPAAVQRRARNAAWLVAAVGFAVLAVHWPPSGLQQIVALVFFFCSPVAARLAGSRAWARLPEPVRAATLNEVTTMGEIKAQMRHPSIRWRWVLKWTGIAFVVVVVLLTLFA